MKKQADAGTTDEMSGAGDVVREIAPKKLVLSRRTVAVLRVRTNVGTGGVKGCKYGSNCAEGSGWHGVTPGCTQGH